MGFMKQDLYRQVQQTATRMIQGRPLLGRQKPNRQPDTWLHVVLRAQGDTATLATRADNLYLVVVREESLQPRKTALFPKSYCAVDGQEGGFLTCYCEQGTPENRPSVASDQSVELRINHRNIVKLFGCCLETEVPLLVYEFISNGTLYHHLHVEEHAASLSWEVRLRITTETARALTYLHSAVAFPIIHRDIKSQNILLDDTMVAKVSDFGASRSITVDEATVVTAVQGTIGYMDPMYYCTGRLTEKSDVYSFGVLLVELLTRKKPYLYRSSEDDSLLVYFTRLLTEGNLVHVLDPQVVEEGGKEVEEVAILVAACVRMEGEDRPTMRQVDMMLEDLRAPHKSMMLPKIDVASYDMAQRESGEKEAVSGQYSLEEEYLLSSRYHR